jgi:hypothetical protein
MDDIKNDRDFIIKKLIKIKSKELIERYEKQIEINEQEHNKNFEEILKLQLRNLKLDEFNLLFKNNIENIHNETYDFTYLINQYT